MNRPLRKRHFLLVALLAPITALLLLGAIAVRRHAPDNPPLGLEAGSPTR